MTDDLRAYFAVEARELVDGLTQGTLEMERTGALPAEPRKRLLRLAHTLKGAARVVRETAVADAAHAIEDLVTGAGEAPDPALGARILALLDAISATLPAPPGEDPAGPAAFQADDAVRAVRVDLAAVDAALERIADLGGRCAALRDAFSSLSGDLPPAARHLPASLDTLSAGVAQLRSQLHQLRLAPASAVFVAVERAVRDAAEAGGVAVRFEASGGEHRLDADVLVSVRDALIQLGRNAVAHGIEPPEARIAARKPRSGLVTLSVERRGSDVVFVVRDDGRGLDVAALRQAARHSGALGEAVDRLTEAELVALLLEGGWSSRGTVSQISGRGVGLDLVRTVVTRLNGRLSLVNTPGRGVAVEMVLPVSLRSLACVRLESAGTVALCPLDAVRGAARLTESATVTVDGRPHLVVDAQTIPIVTLRSAVSAAAADGDEPDRVAALVMAEGAPVAVAAARFGETATIVAQTLPPLTGAAPSIRAVALDESGRVLPVIEPRALAALARAATRPPARAAARVPRLLVVDDSITTRMLEQSILETAGFTVDTAASAEDALTKAAAAQYDLFVVDVEMPGMNGFDFIAAARADDALAAIPAVLVTSRSSEADRQRGLAAGARAYIVKGEFDQEAFLRTVRGLVG